MERISEVADHTIHICFLFLAFFVPLILTPFNYELFEYNKMMLTYGITAVIVCAWVSKMIAQKRFFIARTPFDIPIGLFVLSQFVSTLFSMDPIVSWFGYYSRFNGGMLSVICYTLLFYAYVSNVKKEFGKKLLFALLGSAIIVSIYGVLEHFGIDKHIWVQDVQARVFSTLGQPNWLAAYITALLPLTFAAMLSMPNAKGQMLKAEKIKYLAFIIGHLSLSVLLFLTLLFTRSRSGLAAFAAVDMLFWGILWMLKQVQHDKKKLFVIFHLSFVICLFVFGTGIPKIDTFIKGSQPALQVAQEPTGPVLESGGTESGVIRKYVWQGALNAWKATPKNMAIGSGTETFAFAFYQYKPVGHNLTSEWDFLYNKAHNEYLNFLATTGIFGLGSYLLFIGSIIYWSIRSLRKQLNVFTIGLFSGWLSLLVTNFFGFSVVVTQLLFFLLPGAMYIAYTKDIKFLHIGKMSRMKHITFDIGMQKILLSITLIFTLLVCGLITLVWFADKTFATGYRSARAGQYANAYAPLRDSVRLNSIIPLYHDEYAVVLSSLALGAFESKDATLAGTLAVYALTENDRAIRISPTNVNFWKSRTKILYALSSIDGSYLPQAIGALIKAQILSPSDPKISYNLAILYGKLGDTQKAVEYLLEAKQLKPNYRDAYYALYIFYTETKQPDKAKEILTQYITTVDSTDNEFKKLLE